MRTVLTTTRAGATCAGCPLSRRCPRYAPDGKACIVGRRPYTVALTAAYFAANGLTGIIALFV